MKAFLLLGIIVFVFTVANIEKIREPYVRNLAKYIVKLKKKNGLDIAVSLIIVLTPLGFRGMIKSLNL